MNPRVYLAGPDVFLLKPEAWAAIPLWRRIALRNEAHIRSCQAIIANLTPFRGPSADVGTVYEVGFARALGLKIFGYATTSVPFLPRTLAATNASETDGAWRDESGLLVEQFGLFDNLMIEGGIAGSDGALVIADAADRWGDLDVFTQRVRAARLALAKSETV